MQITTELLDAYSDGDPEAERALLDLVYRDLHRLAGKHMRQESLGHTLQATALANEVWCQIATTEHRATWPSKAHFFAWASVRMRNFLCDYARKKGALKRGGNRLRVTFDGAGLEQSESASHDLIDVVDAIEALAQVDELLAKIAQLRVLLGFDGREIARELGLDERQVQNSLRAARAWLRLRLRDLEDAK